MTTETMTNIETATQEKFCFDCRWAERVKGEDDFAWCRRPNRQIYERISKVSGRDRSDDRVSAYLERLWSSDGDRCGPDARFFEPRRNDDEAA